MKDRKRRLETFSFYDRTGLETHLAKMARKGWLLEKVGQFFWTYRKIEPKTLAFSVCYFPKASQFDPGPSEDQQTFYDFCAHTGWTLAASNAQLQIFYNERENPVPIETDPVLEVEAIHRTMKRSFLPSQLALLAVAVLNTAMLLYHQHNDPITWLSSPSIVFTPWCWALVFLLIGVECGSYFRWHAKAVRAAERGEYLETHSHRGFQIGCLAVLAVWLGVYLLSVLASGDRLMITIMALMFLYVPGAILIVNGLKRFMKSMSAPAGVNRAVTLAGGFVLTCAVVGIITFGTLHAYNRGWFRGNRETYEYNGRTYTVDRDQVPLELDDLLEGDFDRYSRERRGSQSFLLGKYTINQWPIGPVELFPKRVFLDYEIILVKAPCLYDLCRETKLHERDYWNDEEPGQYCYEPVDPAPWGAAEAYQWARAGTPDSQFLLCYPDRLVEISLDWVGDPTPEQMAVVGEKLGDGAL